MSDSNEKARRPNAAYRLSEKTPEDGELNFRYSREARLARAPQAVKDLYNDDKKPRFGFLRPLIGNKGQATVFFSILIMCVVIIVLSITDRTGSYDLEGNRIEAKALKYEGTIVVVLKKTVKKNVKTPYTGAVDIGAAIAIEKPEDVIPELFFNRVFFSAENTEEYRFSLPFESDNIIMVLQTERDSLSIKLKVD